ncbi:hypothetical protein RFN25_31715, partial [Mesorhizobium abyssinicae]|uniref:hypothetical protein n=1 Tax=Mesorhizobium abyssinicae TaxID=1209958 RepID=UPI002A245781
KLKNGSGYSLLKDSVPCPIPTNRKRCAPRRSFKFDITHEAAGFNHDRIGGRAVRTLSPSVVAQMTRFGLTQKALINYRGARTPCERPESGAGQTELRRACPSRQPGNRRRIAAWRGGITARNRFFRDNDAGLLIVPKLFFIQRRNGEVAEWSKALPC